MYAYTMENKKRNNVNPKEALLLILISLYCFNFMRIGEFFPLLFTPFIFIYLFKNRLSKSSFLACGSLLFFLIVYSLFTFYYGYSNAVSIIGKLIYPISFYLLGDMVANGDRYYKRTINFFLLIIISYTGYAVASTLKTIYMYGSFDVVRQTIGRVSIDIWSSNVVSATAINAFLAFGLSLGAVVFMKFNKNRTNKKIKRISFVCFATSVYSVVLLGNRTGLVIIITCLLVSYIYGGKLTKSKLRNIFLAPFLIMASYLFYEMNLFGIKDAWSSTYLSNRFASSELSDDPRIMAWKSAFQGLFEFPMGGKQTQMLLGSPHNMWLDVGYEAGLIPFILLVIFTIISIVSLRKFNKLNHPKILKILVLCLFTSFYLTFFVEPILLGLNRYFTIFCFMLGAIQRLNGNTVRERN